jgi:glutathione S-transferase
MSTAQDITLYMLPGTCAVVPHILLNRAGLQFKYEGVTKDKLYSDFKSTNPKQQLPVLVIDDQTITEVRTLATVATKTSLTIAMNT